jgi:RNA polymerase I-specific transcription initiation factor RRN5
MDSLKENLEGKGCHPELDEESASAYENSSEAERLSTDSEHPSLPKSTTSKRNKRPRRHRSYDEDDQSFVSKKLPRSRGSSKVTDEWLREDAKRFAATFQPPQSPGEIRTPKRKVAGSRTKRKASRAADEIKPKRVKKYASKEYRELLNIDIYDAAARAIAEDEIPLLENQIGSSTWTPEEQHLFFSALSRVGRNNVPEIAVRIGVKSAIEIQEYINLLHRLSADDDRRNGLQLTDYPAAVEVSDELNAVLEVAGDVLAAEQLSYEEKKEEAKWGESWLLTHGIAKQMEKDRKDTDEDLEGTSLAVNLMHLENWLELSRRIFMNAATPQEDNWKSLTEDEELPSIRATAFEDFHSLAVSITKRLVSTTIWYTSSRQRARGSNKVKHGEVNREDVEAAVKTLGLQVNGSDFWLGCARRNKLLMIDDEQGSDSEDDISLTYDKVEAALSQEPIFRARSVSFSQHSVKSANSLDGRVDSADLTDSLSELEDSYSNDESLHSYAEDSALEDNEGRSSKTRREEARKKITDAREANERAQAAYVDAHDAGASRLEEQRLWALLHQEPPSEIKAEPLDMPDRPKVTKPETTHSEDWRMNTEYWSPWEMLPSIVPERSFAENRMRSRRPKRAASIIAPMSNENVVEVEASEFLRTSVEKPYEINNDQEEQNTESNGVEEQALENTIEEEANNINDDDIDLEDEPGFLSPPHQASSDDERVQFSGYQGGSDDDIEFPGRYSD